MNLPNRLTLLRVILIPFFVAALLIEFPFHYAAALLIFIAASITDALDGKIARKHNLITNFGKFLDPLADKILVLAALICFVDLGLCSSIVVLIVITREFCVTSLRLIAASEGTVIAAGLSGKIKTCYQMISIIAVLVLLGAAPFLPFTLPLALISHILMWINALLTVWSGVDYFIQNKSCINCKN